MLKLILVHINGRIGSMSYSFLSNTTSLVEGVEFILGKFPYYDKDTLIDKYSGIVIGWEATNYATNHTNRSVPSPEISITEANKVISPALTVIDTRLAIIPQQYVGEYLTYEYICEWKDYTYYVYVDTVTGEEVQILRVVKTTRGDLIV